MTRVVEVEEVAKLMDFSSDDNTIMADGDIVVE
jgi:hypothetical protein